MSLISVAAVRAHILSSVEPLIGEPVSIYEARGRVLAEDLRARLTQPPFNASAMDGYAVRAADVAVAPVTLSMIGASAAGHGFDGSVGNGEAVRIFTGAPVPAGADTVVIQENTEVRASGNVTVTDAAAPGSNVRLRGYDFSAGDVLIAAGTVLESRHLMLAAAMNHAKLPVRRRPVIAVLANGDELVPPGTQPRSSQIVSSIPAALKASIETWGGEPQVLGIARDNKESLAAAASAAREAHALVTIGGASVGEHDLVRAAFEARGARFEVLKAAMRPGKPVMFGFMGAQRLLSLPGNPASAMICALMFLKPLIKAFLGAGTQEPSQLVPLACAIGANGPREHYMRARRVGEAVLPSPDQDSSLIGAFAGAQCLVIRPVNAPSLPQGSLVPVISLEF